MSTPDQLLAAKISGTSRRCVNDEIPDAESVSLIKDRAANRSDLIRYEAARTLGAWLGDPGMPAELRRANLLLAAADPPYLDKPAFLAEIEVVRKRVAGPGPGASDSKGYRPPA